MKTMTRSELAKRTGLKPETIRYYENEGVLPKPIRAANGYRTYTEDYLVKIKFIKDAKSLGYSLKEIKETLQILSSEMEIDALKEVVSNKIRQLEAKIESLHKIKKLLGGLLETAEADIENYLKSFLPPK
ncbi:MerR family transcriptional regulator [Paenibacillus apiarius]|uniref:MerR family transcriptional regulator n=1 Tax=Paenibacillus apiarius TaxID=46240 RepID=A0ABT4E1N5_9BACL|nr:MerR family transcriptional regulator [Paenibacillus apiarius]MCY9516931.1 MerR family transcriptional regulator [Paenibacillus apiarius]MCY9523517.1 MerR family transcriptional regulator [Paenibacillus apiarius]MCY9554838.1 MerR family transcriptional regulator [Paenibacillus apiarius]MCY9561303.1 MerR family transcriptional regulator [Paenibacillus apiarius]MCY9686980.1 MerR family transcriptional regulator [Paenibacillus apiarius]